MPKPTPTIQKIFTLPSDLNDKFVAMALSLDLSQTEFFRRMVKRLTPEDVLSTRRVNTPFPSEIKLPEDEPVTAHAMQPLLDEDSDLEQTSHASTSVKEHPQLGQASATQDIPGQDVEQSAEDPEPLRLVAPLSHLPVPDSSLVNELSDSFSEDI